MPEVARADMQAGWITVLLNDVVDVISDRWDRNTTNPERLVAGEHIDERDMRLRRWGRTDDDLIPPTFDCRFQQGDALLHSRNLDKVAQPDFGGITGKQVFVLRTKDKETLLQELVPYLVASDHFRRYAESVWSGSTNKFLSKAQLVRYEFALPPLEEQRRIAEAMQALESFKAAVIRSMRSIDDVYASLREYLIGRHQPRIGNDSLNSESSDWGKEKMCDVAHLQMGYAFKSSLFCEKGVQLLRMGNIQHSKLDLSSAPVFLPEEVASAHSDYLLRPGDIVMSMTGTVGKKDYGYALQIPEAAPPLLLNQRICRIRAKGDADQDFLAELARSEPFLQEVYSGASGNKQANFSHKSLAKLLVSLPSNRTQQDISDKLSECFSSSRHLELRLEAIQDVEKNIVESLNSVDRSAAEGSIASV